VEHARSTFAHPTRAADRRRLWGWPPRSEIRGIEVILAGNYRRVLKEIEGLMMAKRNTHEGDRLDVLVTLVEAWERKHYPLDLPDPGQTRAVLARCCSLVNYGTLTSGLEQKGAELANGERACSA
jgi:hypothetical protein